MNEINRVLSEFLLLVQQGSPVMLLALVGITAITHMGFTTFDVIDAVLLYVGFESGPWSLPALMVVLATTTGRMLGSSVVYWLSRQFGRRFADWLGRRFPALHHRLKTVTDRLKVHQSLALVVAWFTPGLLLPSSVAYGMLRLSFKGFLLGIALYSVIADGGLLLVGYLGKRGTTIAGITPQPWQILAASFILVVLISLAVILIQRLISRRIVGKDRTA
jgi:membrane protein DedA with SNARE-associated domain